MRKQMKVVRILLLFNSSIAFAQQSKPIIDTGILGTWPILTSYEPVISSSGDYVAYGILNKPLGWNTFVIQDTRNSWKKEFVSKGLEHGYFFSGDSRTLIWKNFDTIFFQALGENKSKFIANVGSFNCPKKRGEWIAYRLKGASKNVTVLNLITGKEINITNVDGFKFNKAGNRLLIKIETKTDTLKSYSLEYIDLRTQKSIQIWLSQGEQRIDDYSFDNDGEQVAFSVIKQKDKLSLNSIWYYRNGMRKAIEKVTDKSKGIKGGWVVRQNSFEFSQSGRWLFFEIEQKVSLPESNKNIAKVDIWSYRDEVLHPAQSASGTKIKKNVVDIAGDEIFEVSNNDEDLVLSPSQLTGDFAVVQNFKGSLEPWMPSVKSTSYWLVSLKDGDRRLLKNRVRYQLRNFSFSPGGRWLVYWDSDTGQYVSYDLLEKKAHNITKELPPVSDENVHGIYLTPVDKIAGWYENDEALLIYDRNDIWKIAPGEKKEPVNITKRYGARNNIKLRFVYREDDLGNEIAYKGNESLLISGFNSQNKNNGFYSISLNNSEEPLLLCMEPYTYYRVNSQKGHYYSLSSSMQPVQGGGVHEPSWIVKRQSAVNYPNYFFTKDFKQFQPLTDLEPQKDYNWLTPELITWKQFDGTMSQGVLYRPENFDPKKKYPVIFNYYEKLSHQLHEFPFPDLTYANINIPWFVSRGYLVFTPDIYFSVANSKGGKTTGESAYNSVVSAAMYLSKLPFVDGKRMGIQGQSFGGHHTCYLVTHSNLFAAASEMAGTTDPIAAYLSLMQQNGVAKFSKQMISEIEQGRYGANPWERPDLYRRNSAVLSADKATTPVLIVHNKLDGGNLWSLGVEFYMALRRLQKTCWMLQYDGEGHFLDNDTKNILDHTIRLTQFFDHYLKGMPAPRWMTENSLAKYKGSENLYELDPDGSCGDNCTVCHPKTKAIQQTKNKLNENNKTHSD